MTLKLLLIPYLRNSFSVSRFSTNGRVAFLLLASSLFVGCHSTRRAEPPPAAHFSVLTYNVNWGGPGADQAAEIIRQTGAEIVCLQETSPQWEQFLRGKLRQEYSFAEFRDSKERMGGGLAFLSKFPAHEVAYIPSDTGWFDGWIVEFETPLGPVQILNVHLRPPVGDKGSWVSGYLATSDDRLAELEKFYSRKRPGIPTLVVGDFNDNQHSRAVRWLQDKGMINALSEFDSSTPTWHWRYHGVVLSRRMDHIVYSPELRCASAQVIQDGASDHFPVAAVFAKAR
jgi:endonuclease/exonuclease/phosphatase (EEP) superfamily protein YafD